VRIRAVTSPVSPKYVGSGYDTPPPRDCLSEQLHIS
jgi:hypothetical protein